MLDQSLQQPRPSLALPLSSLLPGALLDSEQVTLQERNLFPVVLTGLWGSWVGPGAFNQPQSNRFRTGEGSAGEARSGAQPLGRPTYQHQSPLETLCAVRPTNQLNPGQLAPRIAPHGTEGKSGCETHQDKALNRGLVPFPLGYRHYIMRRTPQNWNLFIKIVCLFLHV